MYLNEQGNWISRHTNCRLSSQKCLKYKIRRCHRKLELLTEPKQVEYCKRRLAMYELQLVEHSERISSRPL